ncbi:MAG TPA: TIGR01777 family oxidoreductase [bacterium]|nr:TIGR01777 family oxidoreductase [bacterium]
MKIILTGGTGFIGKALLDRLLELEHRVVLLTRNPMQGKFLLKGYGEAQQWDGETEGPWTNHFESADAVINLAGESIVAKRWTTQQKARIISSRIKATKAIANAIAKAGKKPAVFVNASAMGYYGNVENGDVTESDPHGTGFLAETCEQWESQAREAEKSGVRVVLTRIGIVLEKNGGALQRMLLPFRFFMGGHLGSGKQWFSWVHREDIVEAIIFLLNQPTVSGPVNLVSPNPVTMKEFCKTLGKVMGRPSWAPVPAFMLRLLLGEMSEMLLTGQRVIPKKLQDAGYRFKYPNLEDALRAILKES